MNDVPESASRQRVAIPLWLSIVGGVAAIIIGLLVVRQIARPLAELVFGFEPEIPIPAGAVLEDIREDQGSVRQEWLYRTDEHGCDLATYFIEQGASCTIAPFVCTDDDRPSTDLNHIAVCRKSEKGVVLGYSWEVWISSGYNDRSQTRFRILLYK